VVELTGLGDYEFTLTVSTDFGSDTHEFPFHIMGWHIEVVDPGPDVGSHSDLALDSQDLPHISYMHEGQASDNFLKYAHYDGTEWRIEIVDDEGQVGYGSSIAVDSQGHPHISYHDARDAFNMDTLDLNYAYHDGTSWHVQTVDSQGNVGRPSSIAVDSSDLPHISYRFYPDFNQGHLKYARFDGLAWHIQTVDNSGLVGDCNSIAVDSRDHPHISYEDHGFVRLKYAHHNGSSWQVEAVEEQRFTGSCSSLALDSLDRPHIAHYVWTGSEAVKYSWYDGEQWHNETVEQDENTGSSCSLALDRNDRPHISYKYGGSGSPSDYLKYAYHDGAAWHLKRVDPESGTGKWSSLELDSAGRPHISYLDDIKGRLKYARYY